MVSPGILCSINVLLNMVGAANEPREEDAMDDEGTEEAQLWHGNVRRKLWKAVCHRAALNVCPTLPPVSVRG